MKTTTSLALLVLGSFASAQQSVGIAVASLTGEVLVFDPSTDTPIGTVQIPVSLNCSDCDILADLSLGFVVDFQSRVWVIDLAVSPPALAAGTNPIPISNNGEDLVISPDQQYLLVCDGGAPQPVSVVDIAARAEIGSYSFGNDCNSIEVAPDGSVLVTSVAGRDVQRLTLDAAGVLSATGETLALFDIGNNSYFAPNGDYAVSFLRDSREVVSYTVPGLSEVFRTDLPAGGDRGVCGAFDKVDSRLFAMSAGFRTSSTVSLHDFDAATGVVAETPEWTTQLVGGTTCYGVEQLALHPNRQKLYVALDGNAEMQILDTSDGSVIGSLALPNASGVCVRQIAECFLVLGKGAGNAAFDAGGHTWETQLGNVSLSYPVTLEEYPSFPLAEVPRRVTNLPATPLHERNVQVLMWNPEQFPTNPEQWSNPLRVTQWSNGRVTARPYGTQDGIDIELEVVRHPDGSRQARFPFAIDGM